MPLIFPEQQKVPAPFRWEQDFEVPNVSHLHDTTAPMYRQMGGDAIIRFGWPGAANPTNIVVNAPPVENDWDVSRIAIQASKNVIEPVWELDGNEGFIPPIPPALVEDYWHRDTRPLNARPFYPYIFDNAETVPAPVVPVYEIEGWQPKRIIVDQFEHAILLMDGSESHVQLAHEDSYWIPRREWVDRNTIRITHAQDEVLTVEVTPLNVEFEYWQNPLPKPWEANKWLKEWQLHADEVVTPEAPLTVTDDYWINTVVPSGLSFRPLPIWSEADAVPTAPSPLTLDEDYRLVLPFVQMRTESNLSVALQLMNNIGSADGDFTIPPLFINTSAQGWPKRA